MPKDLVKSMQTYARLLDGALETIDDLLTQVPAEGAAPKTVLDDLEKAKAKAEARFDSMDESYAIQSSSGELAEDIEKAYTKVYNEAKARYVKVMADVDPVLDARTVPAAPTVQVQPARPPARIVEDLRPKEKLTSTMSLEAMRAWAEQYRNFMAQNEKAFEEQGLKTARAYLTGSIDAKLTTRLKTMRGEDGNLKVSDETTVDQVL